MSRKRTDFVLLLSKGCLRTRRVTCQEECRLSTRVRESQGLSLRGDTRDGTNVRFGHRVSTVQYPFYHKLTVFFRIDLVPHLSSVGALLSYLPLCPLRLLPFCLTYSLRVQILPGPRSGRRMTDPGLSPTPNRFSHRVIVILN